MTKKKLPASKVVTPPAPKFRDEKTVVRTWNLKPVKRSPYTYASEEEASPSEPFNLTSAMLDLAARVDTMERCGVAPRVTASDDTIGLYYWKKVEVKP